jgi:hypothetical protein
MKSSINHVLSLLLAAVIMVLINMPLASAFTPNALPTIQVAKTRLPMAKKAAPPLGKKKPKTKLSKEDLAFLETRDMTREEMFALNQKNEDIMNAELAGMTVFSLILSIPMLYLVWVGFFSETANTADL